MIPAPVIEEQHPDVGELSVSMRRSPRWGSFQTPQYPEVSLHCTVIIADVSFAHLIYSVCPQIDYKALESQGMACISFVQFFLLLESLPTSVALLACSLAMALAVTSLMRTGPRFLKSYQNFLSKCPSATSGSLWHLRISHLSSPSATFTAASFCLLMAPDEGSYMAVPSFIHSTSTYQV